MELVYLWVEKYKNIKSQGFNFSPRFECKFHDEYDEKGKLKDNCKLEIIEKKEDEYIKDFFGDNINVTAIVGKNGSGKSAILDTLINDIIFNDKTDYKRQRLYCYLSDAKDELYINSFLVTEEDVQCKFKYKMTHVNSEDNIPEYTGSSFQYRVKRLDNFINEYNQSFFYLFNNSLESDNYLRQVYTYNEELLFYAEIDKSDNIINLENENNKIYSYLVELFLNNARLPKELKEIWAPRKIFMDREIFVTFFNKEIQEEDAYRNFLDSYNIEEVLKLETLIYLRHFINNHTFHHSWDEDIKSLNEVFNSQNIVNNFNDILSEVEEKLRNIYSKITSIKNQIRHDDNRSNDAYLKNLIELEKISDLLKESSIIASLISNIRDDPYYDYELNTNMLNKENIAMLKKLPSYLLVDFASKEGVKFSMLSSGEQNILKLLFSIENIIHLRKDKTRSFNILLDEIENSFHPDWQKRFIVWLVNFFKNYEDLQLNFIITTHSPFLLSDIPKQNIIFLDTYKEKDIEVKEEKQEVGNCRVVPHAEVFDKKQTFGQNIHTLLSDSFFMKDGLMGEFAKGKINEIIEFHKEVEEKNKKNNNLELLRVKYKEDKTKFWNTQSIIGDEYLKQVIKNHLVDMETILLGKDGAKEEEIRRLRTEADRLENLS